MITIEVHDEAVQAALRRLAEASTNLLPVMQEIGEQLVETTKQRFQASRAPDGSIWPANARSTIEGYLGAFSSSFSKKTGKITQAGSGRATGKKPLIGETRSLSATIDYTARSNYVEIGSPMEYAAVHQFGAKKHSFTGGKTPWGDIPARPFLGLSVDDQGFVVLAVERYLGEAAKGP